MPEEKAQNNKIQNEFGTSGTVLWTVLKETICF